MNKNNQATGLPRLDVVVRALNLAGGLPVWIEVHKAKPLDAGGFEGYVRDIESVVGLSPQGMAEQIDKPGPKKLMQASTRPRLVTVDRKSWRVLTEIEQPDLGVKNAAATCFGNEVTVTVVYHALSKSFSDDYSSFSSVVDSLAFDPDYKYNPKAHSTPAPGLVFSSLKMLSKLTTPVGLLLVLLLVMVWRSDKRRKVLRASREKEDRQGR